MKTIYIITSSFPPSSIVGGLRPFRLAKHITKAGWKAEIITTMPNVNYFHNTALLNELNPSVQIHYLFNSKKLKIYNPENINTFFSKTKHQKERIFNKIRLFARIIGTSEDILNKMLVPDIDVLLVPFFLHKLSKIFFNNQNSIILTTSPPHSIHLAGLIFSKNRKVPWIADFRDPWDYYPETGNIKIPNPIERKMERAVIKNADAVISTTKTYNKNLVKKHFDLDSNKFYKITNSYDHEKMKGTIKKVSNRFVISYPGIFYPQNDPFTFFRAIRSWFDVSNSIKKEKYKKLLRIQLIGSQARAVKNVINELNLSSVVSFIDRVPHEEAIRLTRASDILLMCYGLGDQTRPGCLPSKLFEYFGCRIPILAISREGEMPELIRETNSGYVITSEDHEAIHSILEKEIEKKLSGSTNTDFTFQGVEQFEEKRVMSDMIQIIEDLFYLKSQKTN